MDPTRWHYTTFVDFLDHWQALIAGTLGFGAAIIAVVATIIIVNRQTKAVEDSLRTDALARFTARWDSPDMRLRRRHLATSLLGGGTTPSAVSDYNIEDVIDFFEDVGALLRLQRFDFDLVWHAFSDISLGWWEAIGRRHADEVRRRDDDPALYSEFEYLATEMEKENARRSGGRHRNYHADDVSQFLHGERDLLMSEPLRIVVVPPDPAVR